MRIYLSGELRRHFLACALITRKIMRSKNVQSVLTVLTLLNKSKIYKENLYIVGKWSLY